MAQGKDIITEIVAIAEPREINGYLNSYGLPSVNTRAQALKNVQAVCLKNGEEAFAKLALIHPHREFILDAHKAMGKDSYSNCAGCGGTCGGTSNADGDQNPNKVTAEPKEEKGAIGKFVENNTTALMLMTTVIVVALLVRK